MRHGIFLAILAAGLYALSTPFSKLLLDALPSTLMAGFLYVGAGLGMVLISLIRKVSGKQGTESRLTRQELPYTIAMVILDIAAPICLLLGLTMTTAANVSLLNNFEIVATAVIALLVFSEAISPRLWLGILFVTASCALLSFEDLSSLQFNSGSLFALLACICWGIEKTAPEGSHRRILCRSSWSRGSVPVQAPLSLDSSAENASFTCGQSPRFFCLALSTTDSASISMSTPREFSAPPAQVPTML